MKIVVLGGGTSSERDVSLVTATSVCKALRSLGHKAIFVDSFLGVDDINNLKDIFDCEDGRCKDIQIGHTAPIAIDSARLNRDYEMPLLGKNVLELCKLADCVFMGLHGADGEDGKIQAYFEKLGIPFTGSGSKGSAVAMDKLLSKMIMQEQGINCPNLSNQIPCVVKCLHGGSSIGTYICDSEDEYEKAIEDIKKYRDDYLVEKKIEGREITVSILDGKALPVVEIIPPESGKFDYISKYQSGNIGAREICPASISEDLTAKAQKMAEEAHKALRLSVYSRADMIIDNEGQIWCLEVNSLPGLTPASLFPKAAKEIGLDYPHLCEKIVELSLQK